MKVAFLFVAAAIIFLAGCSSAPKQPEATIEGQPAQEKSELSPLVAKLSRTWYPQTIIVDGEIDSLNFPSEDDELTLRSNMTYIAFIGEDGDTVEGGWRLVDAKTFEIEEASSGETRSFGIEKLTEDSLITSLDDFDEAEVLVVYSSRKD